MRVCSRDEAPSKMRDERLQKFAILMLVSKVIGEKEPKVVLGKQVDERPVPFSTAVVQQRSISVTRILPKAVGPAGRAGRLYELGRVHQ